jgi:hypothetical protein
VTRDSAGCSGPVTVTVTALAGTRLCGTETVTETRASSHGSAGAAHSDWQFESQSNFWYQGRLSHASEPVSLSLTPAVTVLFKFESHSGQAAA